MVILQCYIQNSVKHLRWRILQKEEHRSAGMEPEIFQGREREWGIVELGKKHKKKRSRRETYWNFVS